MTVISLKQMVFTTGKVVSPEHVSTDDKLGTLMAHSVGHQEKPGAM
jgi:hypothetical protein